MSEEREEYQFGDATLGDYMQPEEAARFDRLWILAKLLTEEEDALQKHSGSLSEAALLKTSGLTLQVIHIERDRLISLAKDRLKSNPPPPPKTHLVKESDKARIRCSCGNPADICHHAGGGGAPFFYYCMSCWNIRMENEARTGREI